MTWPATDRIPMSRWRLYLDLRAVKAPGVGVLGFLMPHEDMVVAWLSYVVCPPLVAQAKRLEELGMLR